jgi:DNA polymerase-3 subunit epsilon
MLGFDLETTAPDPTEARIVTAAIVIVNDGKTRTDHWLINPGMDIPEEAAAIHGITTEKAQADGQDPEIALGSIAHVLGMWTHNEGQGPRGPMVAFNASYDFTVLDRELTRHNLQSSSDNWRPIVDPFVIDRHCDKYRKGKRTLGATVEHYKVALDEAHEATADALGALRLAWRLPQVFPELAEMELDRLHHAQAIWHAERQDSFRAYLEREGKDASGVNGEWPIRGDNAR